MQATNEDEPGREVLRLRRRLERERLARREAEGISERATRALYDERAGLELLKSVAVACNSADTIDAAMRAVVEEICGYTGWPVGHGFLLDHAAAGFETAGIWHLHPRFAAFREATEQVRLNLTDGLPGRAQEAGRPIWVVDVLTDPDFVRVAAARQVGLRSAVGLPVLSQGAAVAVLEFFSPRLLEPDEALLDLMCHIALQLSPVFERQRGERELARFSRRIEVLLNSAGEGIYGVAPDSRTIFANDAAASMLGCAPSDLVGRDLHGVLHVSPDGQSRHGAGECPLREASTMARVKEEDEFYRRDGSTLPVEYMSTPMYDDGVRTGTVITFNDITDRRRFESQLRYLADHDVLTGLLNRRGFEAALAGHVSYGRRYRPAGAVLMLDLDHFKDINDTLGHQAGDDVIRSVAAVLRDRLRDSDVVARLGGDEFVVLLPHADRAQAEVVAAAVADAIRRHTVPVCGRRLHVTTSIGVAPLRDPQLTGEEVLVEADIALYQAKDAGRDGYAIVEPDGPRPVANTARQTWIERIRRALDENLFMLYAQPILQLSSGRISQVELLLRMRGDDGEVLTPDVFLPLAERFGLMPDIDRWVIREAIRLLAEHRDQRRELSAIVEINLSGRSVGDPLLLALIEKELQSSGVPADALVFEITETAAIAHMDQARQFAGRLTEIGCRLALDDFGAGFGSFYYVKYLPLTYLKIDGDFVVNLAHSAVDQHIVRAMVEVARCLGLKTIAEFVGDDQTLEALHTLGVDYAQGFHIGKPLPVDELTAYL